MAGELDNHDSEEPPETPGADVPEVTAGGENGSRLRVQPLVFLIVFLALVIGGVVAAITVLGDGDDETTPDVDTSGEPGALEDGAGQPVDEPAPDGADDLARGADLPASESASYYGGDSWLVPWGEGFLEIGLTYNPPPLPEITDEIAAGLAPELLDAIEASGATTVDDVYRLIEENELWELFEGIEGEEQEDPLAFMYEAEPPPPTMEVRRSADGTNWETLEGFSIPGGENVVGVASDGTNLLVATQTWEFAGEREPGRTSMFVATTTDLENWNLHELPSADPSSVPEHVSIETGLSGVTIGPNGWLAVTNTWTWLDEWTLLSEVMGETEAGWDSRADESGLTVDVYAPFEGELDGDIAPYYPVVSPEEAGYPVVYPEEEECCEIAETRFFSWDELGIDYATWQRYHEGEGGTTSSWTAAWGADPVETTIDSGLELGSVAGTDAGFVGLAWGREDGATTVRFSEDGRTWVERTSPAEGAGIWIDTVTAVEGGLVASGSSEHMPGTLLWRADADATNWELIEVPGLPSDTWFGLYSTTSTPGVAAIVDLRDYSIYEPPEVQVDLDIEHDGLMISTDQRPDEGSSVLITDMATGEVLLEASSDVSYPQDIPEYLVLAEEGVAFVDPETGDVVVEMTSDEILSQWQPAYDAALAEAGWVEPTDEDWQGDFWLLASADGSAWLLEDLADDEPEPWPQAAAINGDTVVARLGDSWSTFSLS